MLLEKASMLLEKASMGMEKASVPRLQTFLETFSRHPLP
jgi:hypothetical protein